MKKHIDYIDVMRVVASLFVVFMHASATGLRTNVASHSDWFILTGISSIAFCAVPLFFMITGYVLTSSERTSDVKVLFKERLPRLIVPLIFWSILYIIYEMISLNEFSLVTFLKKIVLIVEKPVNISLWFMYLLVAMYLISPLLCSGLKSLNKQGEKLILGIIIIVELISILGIVAPSFSSRYLNIEILNYFNIFDGNLASFILGWYLGKTKKHFSSIAVWLTMLVTYGIIVAGTINLSSILGKYISTFQSQNSGLEILIASCIFILIKQSKILDTQKIKSIAHKISDYTFPIYLMHSLILLLLANTIVVTSAGGVIIETILVYFVALLIAFICSHIPFLSYLTCGIKKTKKRI